MSIAAAAIPAERDWRGAALALAGSWAALLLLFHRDTEDLARIYWTNTSFGHCLFIGPVIAWLVWQRRALLVQVPAIGWLPALAAVFAGGLLWLAGEAAGVALFRHAGLVAMLQGAVLVVLGPNIFRALLFPIAYMVFLVPCGSFLEPPLQRTTIAMVMPLLHAAGVPAHADGMLIATPKAVFEVAEACSGAKFVIAMAAYGVLVAHVGFISWRLRAVFLVLALAVPVLANGLRAFGTIYAAWHTSVAAATGIDHIVYGWLFFAVVMAAVLAIGWRWFDRDPDTPAFDPARLQALPRRRIDPLVAAALVLTTASLFPAWAAIGATRPAPLPPALALPAPPGWRQVPPAPPVWTPHYPGADRFARVRYVDTSGRTVDLALAAYASQREGKELVGFGIGAIGENDRWVKIVDEPGLARGAAMRMTGPGGVERTVVTWYRIGTVLTGSEERVKLETLATTLLARSRPATALLIAAESRGAITDFLAAAGSPATIADRAAGTR